MTVAFAGPKILRYHDVMVAQIRTVDRASVAMRCLGCCSAALVTRFIIFFLGCEVDHGGAAIILRCPRDACR